MGAGTAERMVIDALRSEESSAALGDKLSVDSEALDEDDRRAVVAVTLGRGLAEVAKALEIRQRLETLAPALAPSLVVPAGGR